MRLLIAYIIVFFYSYNLYAEKPDYQFKHLSTKEGLSHVYAISIIQDQDGYMWFGTWDGLNRYDGYEFKYYYNIRNDSNSLCGSGVYELFLDSKNCLWICTNEGIDRYDKYQDKFIHYPFIDDQDTTYFQNARTIYEDKEGNIWASAQNRIYKLNESRTAFIEYLRDFKRNLFTLDCREMVEDSIGQLWMATYEFGPVILDRVNRRAIYIDEDFTSEIHSVIRGNSDRIWFTSHKGLYYCDVADGKNIISKYKFSDGFKLSSEKLWVVHLDRSKYLWIGTDKSGLNLLDLTTNELYLYKKSVENRNAISSNMVRSIYRDRQNSLWFGTNDGGVNYFSISYEKRFHSYSQSSNNQNGLDFSLVSALYEDGEKNVWVGTDGGGLKFYNRKKSIFKTYLPDDSDLSTIPSNAIMDIVQWNQNDLLIATFGGGLCYFDRKSNSFTRLRYPELKLQHSAQNTMDICKDREGFFWIATNGAGVFVIDSNLKFVQQYTMREIEAHKGLPSNYLAKIYQDQEQNMWFGTYYGASCLNSQTGQFENYFPVQEDTVSLSHTSVYTIYEDSMGKVWFGTENGLNCFSRDQGKFSLFTEKDGLSNNSIFDIQGDRDGNLWISTRNGLSFLDTETFEFKTYNIHDGLPGNQFVKNSSFKNSSGRLFFGNVDGFVEFDSDSIQANPYSPPVLITKLMVHNKPVETGAEGSPLSSHVSYTDKIELSYGQSVISFEYVALNYISTQKNQYAYILEGFDKDWNYVGTKRVATYTNLKPGKYCFHVIGSNNDGKWNENGARLNIIIHPPFWQTWIFRIVIFIIVLIIIIGSYQYRTVYTKKRNIELEKMVKNANQFLWDLKRAMEQTFDGIALFDVSYKIFFANHALARMHGYQADELIDQSIKIFYDPDYYQNQFLPFLSKVNTYQQDMSEFFNKKKDGSGFAAWISMKTILNDSKQIIGYIAIIRDVSQQKKDQQLLEEARRKEVENAQRDGMANIATHTLHNVGNILNSLLTSCSLVRRILQETNIISLTKANEMLKANFDSIEYFIKNDPKGRKLFEFYLKIEDVLEKEYTHINTHIDRLLGKANEITEVISAQQNYAKVSGLEGEKTSLRKIIDDALTMNRSSFEKYHIIIKKEIKEIPLLSLQKTKFMQVLMNLMNNAKDALRDVDEDKRLLIFQLYRESDSVVFQMIDTGCGIEPNYLDDIFNNGFTTKPDSYGLGLYASKKFINEMGGTLEAISDGLGMGATFRISFPIHSQKPNKKG